MITGPYGAVPVKAAPFLFSQYAPNAAASGDSPTVLQVFGGGGNNHPTAAGADGVWGAARAGAYIYQIVGVGVNGSLSAPITANAVTLGAAEHASFSLPVNDAIAYYRVYRSDKGGLVGTCRHVFDVKGITGQVTPFTDKGDVYSNTSKVLFVLSLIHI